MLRQRPDEPLTTQSPAFLLVDAGNTRVKFGLFHKLCPPTGQLPACAAFAAHRIGDPALWPTARSAVADDVRLSRTVLTGSNPRQMERLVREWPADWPPPDVLTDRTLLPIEIDVDEPQRVGIDRLLDAVAANVLRAPGSPAIVIDVGTATTVNAVSKSGAFVGGAILPGPELCARALHEYTAVLPEVPLTDLLRGEPAVIGRNTEDAIRSGLYWGHWQAVLGYCERMQLPLGCPPEPLVLLTGGAAHLYAERAPCGTPKELQGSEHRTSRKNKVQQPISAVASRPPGAARYEPHLTLQGLAVAVTHLFADAGES
ncbi:MAG: type III pantothenate kinase [Planctomycetaceae bacterium]